VGSLTPSANVWTDLSSITATLSGSLNNVVVMLWSEGTLAQNATLDIGSIECEPGSAASAFEKVPYAMQIQRCQRRYIKSYALGTKPGTAFTGGTGSELWGAPSTAGFMTIRFPTRMRTTPSVATYDSGGNGGKVSYYNGSWNNNGTATAATVTDTGFQQQTSISGSSVINFEWAAGADL